MATNTSFENAIRVNRTNRTIEVSKAFDKAASRFGTREYEALQKVRKDYPEFTVVVKAVRTKVDHFKGLTYDFMEKYIASHDDEARMAEFNNLRGTSEEAQLLGAAARPYGEIKVWFLNKHPEFEAFQKRREDTLAA